jgi:hypothetical protein
MKIIAGLLLLLPAGCAGVASPGNDSRAWQVDEKAAKDGSDPKLHLGMAIDAAMNFLEEHGFKRDKYSALSPWRENKPYGSTDDRPAFRYSKEIPGSSLWSGSSETLIWLYYDAGNLIDVRVRYHSICL